MITLFENNDFILKLTGHDYDFVGIIENKNEERLTFFFDEDVAPLDENDEDSEWEVLEDKTKLLGVYSDLATYDEETGEGWDEAEEVAEHMDSEYGQIDWFTTREDRSTGFLACPKERGQFLAIVKSYCPDKLSEIPWA